LKSSNLTIELSNNLLSTFNKKSNLFGARYFQLCNQCITDSPKKLLIFIWNCGKENVKMFLILMVRSKLIH